MTGDLYFAPTPGGPCGGLGVFECLCGGDQCVCHNHGEVECPGCADCEDLGAEDCSEPGGEE